MQNWLMCLFQACFVLFKVELIVGFFLVRYNEAIGIVIRNSQTK